MIIAFSYEEARFPSLYLFLVFFSMFILQVSTVSCLDAFSQNKTNPEKTTKVDATARDNHKAIPMSHYPLLYRTVFNYLTNNITWPGWLSWNHTSYC